MRKVLTVVLEIEDDDSEGDPKSELNFAEGRVRDVLTLQVQEDVAPVTIRITDIPGETMLPGT